MNEIHHHHHTIFSIIPIIWWLVVIVPIPVVIAKIKDHTANQYLWYAFAFVAWPLALTMAIFRPWKVEPEDHNV